MLWAKNIKYIHNLWRKIASCLTDYISTAVSVQRPTVSISNSTHYLYCDISATYIDALFSERSQMLFHNVTAFNLESILKNLQLKFDSEINYSSKLNNIKLSCP